MSNPVKDDAMNKLYATIKSRFEHDGVLKEVRCMLQTKMVAMMKGNPDAPSPISSQHRCGSDPVHRDARVQMLHKLIMEYFHWHGYRYSAEMFAMESGSENTKPVRECLDAVMGSFDDQQLPILLEMVANLMEQKQK